MEADTYIITYGNRIIRRRHKLLTSSVDTIVAASATTGISVDDTYVMDEDCLLGVTPNSQEQGT